jgi:MFS family permease
MLFVITVPYAQLRFGATPGMAGLVGGLMVIGNVIGRFASGPFIGRVGSKKAIFTGFIAYLLFLTLYVPANSLPLFFLVRLFSGIGLGCANTVTATTVAHILPNERRGQGIGYFSLSNIIGLALGPFLGLVLGGAISYEWLFLLCLAGGALAFTVLFLPSLSRALDQETPAAAGAGAASSLCLRNCLDWRVAPFGLFMLVAGAGYGNLQAFISGFAKEVGLVDIAGLFFVAYAVAVFATRPYTGKVFDRRGENRVLYPAILLMALGLLTLSLSRSGLSVLGSGFLFGAGFGNIQSIGQAVSLKLVNPDRFAQATSTFYVLLDFGIGFGPYAFGYLVPAFGYAGMFLITAGLGFACLPLYHFLHGRWKFVKPE